MTSLYRYLQRSPNALALTLLTAFAFVFNLWASSALTARYIASRFPVPYYEAQLSFSADKLKGWYATLEQLGTFDAYLQTQHFDSVFILSVLMLHGGALLLISRLFSAGSRGRKAMVLCALLSAIAPLSDQLENLVSYVMLANPAGFANWLAYVYSSFAATKFAFFVFAYLAAPLGLVVGVANLGLRRYRQARGSAVAAN
jgi:hypothetical protein